MCREAGGPAGCRPAGSSLPGAGARRGLQLRGGKGLCVSHSHFPALSGKSFLTKKVVKSPYALGTAQELFPIHF